jgi:hypothetical protein
VTSLFLGLTLRGRRRVGRNPGRLAINGQRSLLGSFSERQQAERTSMPN